MVQDDTKKHLPFGVHYVPPAKRARREGNLVYGGRVGELPPGKGKQLVLDNFSIALFNVAGKYYAVKDACPHAAYPLSKGVLRDEVVICASHNWQFDVTTGRCLRGEQEERPDIRTYPVELKGAEIWVKILS